MPPPHKAKAAPAKFTGNMNKFGHVSAFGRKTTRPNWYTRAGLAGQKRELFMWDANDCGYPRYKPKAVGGCAFIHSDPQNNPDLYRTNPPSIVERHALHNANTSTQYNIETRKSRTECQETKRLAQETEAHATIYGNGPTIPVPVLYSTGATHDQMLVADGKVCPRPTVSDAQGYRLPTPGNKSPIKRYNQTMYMPYCRTRRYFNKKGYAEKTDKALGVMMQHRAQKENMSPQKAESGVTAWTRAAGRPSGVLSQRGSNPVTHSQSSESFAWWNRTPNQQPMAMSQSLTQSRFDPTRPHH